MRSPSERCWALERSPCFRWFFSCGLRSARSPIRPGPPADCSLHCWCLARNSDLFFGLACQLAVPSLHVQPEGFAVVGMAALFTGIVRAPLTGIVLATEMTADVTMLLPMLGACAMAMLTPTLIKDPPIYDSLRDLTVVRERARLGRAAARARAQMRESDVRHKNFDRCSRGSRDMAEAQCRRFSGERRGRYSSTTPYLTKSFCPPSGHAREYSHINVLPSRWRRRNPEDPRPRRRPLALHRWPG